MPILPLKQLQSFYTLLGINAEYYVDQGSRFVIGIDLGTTNTAVCYLDFEAKSKGEQKILPFSIHQFDLTGIVKKLLCYPPLLT